LAFDKVDFLLDEPFSILSILIGGLFLRSDGALKAIESIWLPVGVLLDLLLLARENTLARGHDHHGDLSLRHCFLRRAHHVVLQRKLQHILHLKQTA
jgi:hypothetical protein